MRFSSIVLFAALAGFCGLGAALPSQAQTSAPSRIVGSVTAVNGKSLTIKPDSGAPVTVTIGDNARILETQPGAKTLAGATPIQASGIAVGDRVLAAITPASDGSSPTATTVICMKQAAIAQRQQADEAAWQHQGVGGLVKSVDSASGTITIASGPRTIAVHTTPATTFRRYSPDSIKFADTTSSSIAAIRPGDQLRARGAHSPDGNTVTADAIVTGAFRNISATVISTDPAANTVTVHDLATKKPIVIHITDQSQLHKLSAQVAEALAASLKHSAPAASASAHPQQSAGAPAKSDHSGAWQHRGGSQNGASQSSADLSHTLARTPTIQISDLHKGDAVMIVATQGTPGSATAVTLVAGVEPILTASPSASQSVFSASWNVGGGGDQAAGESGTP